MACKECERRRAQMKEWLGKKAEQVAKWTRVRDGSSGRKGSATSRATKSRPAVQEDAAE